VNEEALAHWGAVAPEETKQVTIKKDEGKEERG